MIARKQGEENCRKGSKRKGPRKRKEGGGVEKGSKRRGLGLEGKAEKRQQTGCGEGNNKCCPRHQAPPTLKSALCRHMPLVATTQSCANLTHPFHKWFSAFPCREGAPTLGFSELLPCCAGQAQPSTCAFIIVSLGLLGL